MNEEKKNNWFQALQDKINSLSEQFGLDEVQTHAFRDFVVTTAREQFKIGSRSGAGWAFKKAREEDGVSAG
ncbi:hypothetical protein CO174_02345 [Candidatus Uhrbacteria bacterium CG_4_9_14_3_um_filter_50_9]|uniref:PH domain-containing protein n=1 Tax=Candidatus Uhrbacteria bacterium CG_4_9_14_3_um_filter_50_9 TaxID=1975035 RepID=A0A2M7XCS0_9BACT|nr:MAG: hypothetical protein CO174_02345 [Candidatus Uhrbacteria bacterium CG_4_9_14_3_um_filter_50_9]